MNLAKNDLNSNRWEDLAFSVSQKEKRNYALLISPDTSPNLLIRGARYKVCELITIFSNEYGKPKSIVYLENTVFLPNNPICFLFRDKKSALENDKLCIVEEQENEKKLLFDSELNLEITHGFVYLKATNRTENEYFTIYYSYDIDRKDSSTPNLISSLCKSDDPKIMGNLKTIAIQQYKNSIGAKYELKE